MKSLTILCLVLAAVSAVFASPVPDEYALIAREHVDLLTDSKKLIEQLVNNLRNAAQDALTAVGNFTSGIREEAQHMREKIASDIEALRGRVQDAIDKVMEGISNTTAGVKECVETHRTEASEIFASTVNKTLECVDNRISSINEQIEELKALATGALEYGNNAMSDLHKCTEENHNLFTAGACLAGVAVKVEAKALAVTTHIGLKIARISLAVGTLPAAMEVCAGARLFEASVATAKIIVQIGGCSAGTIFSGVFGTNTPQN